MAFNDLVTHRLAQWAGSLQDLGPVILGETRGATLEEIRRAYIDTMAQHPTPEGVRIEPVDMGGVPGTLVTPDDVVGDRVLFYIHGGAYIVGGPGGYHGLAGAFAKAMKARVYLPDYRLAPEHPFPTPIDDTFSAYRWLIDQGQDPRSVTVAGDSAGGAMVVTVMVMARNAGVPLPAGGAALSPWANLEHTGASMFNREGLDPLNTKAGLDLMARTFLGGALPNSPEASPVFADVRGLPPILVQIGEAELMLSDAIRLANHLGENRVRVSLEIWPNMFHVWHMFQAELAEGRAAIGNAATFLEQAIASAQAGS
ncbi:alpha/beta hydrolase [Methylobacterium sp. 37f]|uniref:alpha/beta hydrolase n=1 Tax=Methylobacterium sp. 37f TaxID=2817058 RepID=UPI001FFCF990|nr:alpha/beta hydrolase [Methylobacterium sp. 37f]MCK2055097.1 alpha/beta hydrolase [Methylobacterium sp. 37f]